MAKDTEKLIRQLSLISYLMAERRPVTATEIRRDVEGYSDMTEDAFARRFYADRAELDALGIHLRVDKPADGFSEQENYSLAPEAFHLPAIEFSDTERAALQTALTLLDDDRERRVVLYTGSSDVELLISGLDSGARGYALKEGTPSELTAALNTVAEGGTYVDPRLRPALLSRRATQRMPSLSKREREIMDLLAQGLTGEQVAEKLVLSSETVKTHIRNAMSKLEASTRVHAIAIALREGYIQPPSSDGGAPE